MARSMLLGIDVGTTGLKAVLFDEDGTVLGSSSVEYATLHPGPAWAEQDPGDWWNATREAVRNAMAQARAGGRDIAAIGVSCQAPTALPISRDGRPLRPALIWMDRRSGEQCEWMARAIGHDTILEITGNRIDPYYVASKILWIKQHEPDLFHNTHKFLQVNGYINYKLTGEFTMDICHGGLTQLFDQQKGEWSYTLCEAMGIPPEKLPEVYPCSAVIGGLNTKAASELGISAGTPVVAGTVDGAAAAVEAGAVRSGQACEMTGQSTVLLICTERLLPSFELISFQHAVPSRFLMVGAMVATGGSLKWFRDQLASAETSAAALLKMDAFDLMTLEASKAPVGAGGLVFLPYMLGERSPIWNTKARGVVFGLSLATTRGELIRAVMEGSAYGLRHNIEVAESLGVSVPELRCVGGGAKSGEWNQIKADVLGKPVLVPETPVGAPLGDAIIAGVGAGIYPDVAGAAEEIVKVKARFEPRPANHKKYAEFYSIYRELYAQLEGTFEHLHRAVNPT
ncbi:MAG TPA: xylulokinase [Firmicutes bacterium]|nr:xylulokinase [Bacillota bacterium]